MAIVCERENEPAVWLARAQAGDPDAFCRLIEPQETRLYRQALTLCQDQALAKDLVQQTLVEAWKSVARYDGSCRLSTWLCAILLHRHYKSLRAARRWPVPFSKLLSWLHNDLVDASQSIPVDQPSPDESIQLSERAQQVRAAVHSLPPPHREVVWLRYFEDVPLAEIAAALGCSIGTVKSRLHHGLKKLRKMKWL